MSYKDLQAEAKELGLKHVGVSKNKLEKSIEEKKGEISNQNKGDTPDKPSEPEKPKNPNVAVVRNLTKQEIRKYTLETHGAKFADLAREFANDREYAVELIEVEKSVVCPSCGHILN